MAALTAEQLGALQAAGRDPSQREQVLASRNLLPSEYKTPNFLTYGNAVSFGQNGEVELYPGKQYVLYDNRTGQQLASGSSAEEIQGILSIINNQLVPQGGKADWRLLDMGGAPTGATLDMHTMLPSGFGEAVKVGDQYGIPIAGDRPNSFIKDMLIPMLTPIAATAGAYFGGNALLGAQGGGGAGAAGAGLGGTGGSAGLGAGTSLASQGLASLPANLAAIQAGANTALAGAGLGTAALAPAAAASSLLPVAAETGIVVTAPAAAATGLEAIAPLAIGTGTAAGALSSAGGAGAGSTAPSATGSEAAAGATPEEIVVTAQKPLSLGAVGPLTPVTQLPELLQSLANTVPPITPEAPPPTSEVGPIDTVKEPGFLDKVTSALRPSDYLKIASLGAGLLGGGNDGSGTRYTGVGGGLSPNFSAKLPTPSMPGASSNFAARPASEINTVNGQPRDWTKYGFGPEASFFSYVPQRGYAYGGDVSHDEPSRSFAVRGPGDGRSDDIPAMLSDGEYVMDAETVALLGNGSPKAGAEVLDQFRVNLRKHKGQKLAKGEFSANAKKPEHYLAGGRI